ERGRIVGPSATTRNMSLQENERISRNCRPNHATQTYFWGKMRAVLSHEAANYGFNASRTALMSSGLLEATRQVTFGSLATDSPATVLSAALDFVTLTVLIFSPRQSVQLEPDGWY